MGASKIIDYSEAEVQIAKFAKALSHPARAAIIRLLLQKQSCVCGDIVEDLPIAQSTVSQHLKELKNMGLIQGSLNGPKSCYCINWEKLEEFVNRFNKLTSELLSKKPAAICCK